MHRPKKVVLEKFKLSTFLYIKYKHVNKHVYTDINNFLNIEVYNHHNKIKIIIDKFIF